jgi:hypothetical protein
MKRVDPAPIRDWIAFVRTNPTLEQVREYEAAHPDAPRGYFHEGSTEQQALDFLHQAADIYERMLDPKVQKQLVAEKDQS